jgi:hypothetical protein
MEKSNYLPRARTEELIVEELTDEVLVYDLRRNKAHCVNSTAAAIWKLCDGRRTVEEIARRLKQPVGHQQLSEEVVWLALAQLSRTHLLDEPVSSPIASSRISRREALKRVGIGAAIAVPIVVSITAPTAVQAGSCFATGHGCGTGSQCCSGICSGGSCA